MSKRILIRLRPVMLLLAVPALALGSMSIGLGEQAIIAARDTSASIVNPAGPPISPRISGLNPSWARPGGPGFTLTVIGTYFVNGSMVRWNDSDRATTYVSDTQLAAAITAADIAAPATASVTVFNPDPPGTSTAVIFVVGTPVYLPLVRTPPSPDVPVLNEIANADGDGNYTVSWSISAGAANYALEQDDNPAFSSPETRYSGEDTSWNATSMLAGTYYYRVQASNTTHTTGWSNVESVVVSWPTGPAPGFWQGTQWTGDPVEFYVTADRAYVDDFAIYLFSPFCPQAYKVVHTTPELISGYYFSFSGPFYASGHFDSEVTASGTLGIDSFCIPISGCGCGTFGPWAWTANWIQSAQSTPPEPAETDRVAPANPNNTFRAARIPPASLATPLSRSGATPP